MGEYWVALSAYACFFRGRDGEGMEAETDELDLRRDKPAWT